MPVPSGGCKPFIDMPPSSQLSETIICSPELSVSSPTEEVFHLAADARQVQGLSTAVTKFFEKPIQKKVFFEVLARQVQLLQTRSQAWEDGHVTVYDKVLLDLTQNGTDLDNPAAVEYFCQEFLGVRLPARQSDVERSLGEVTATFYLFSQSKSPQFRARGSRIS